MKTKGRQHLAAALTTVVLSMSAAGQAHAWGPLPVIEVGPNVVANSVTQYEQHINTAQSMISAYNDVLQTWNQISTFDVASVFLGTEEKQALMKFIETGKSVHGALRKTQSVYDNLQQSFAISPFKNFEDYLKDFGRRHQHGETMARTLYDSAKLAEDELQKAHEQHMRVVNEMPDIQGVTEAAKATAQSVGVLIQQNQGITQMMAQQIRVAGQELQREYQERALADQANLEILEAQHNALMKDRSLVGGK